MTALIRINPDVKKRMHTKAGEFADRHTRMPLLSFAKSGCVQPQVAAAWPLSRRRMRRSTVSTDPDVCKKLKQLEAIGLQAAAFQNLPTVRVMSG